MGSITLHRHKTPSHKFFRLLHETIWELLHHHQYQNMLCTLTSSFKIVYNINISVGTPKYLIITLDHITITLHWHKTPSHKFYHSLHEIIKELLHHHQYQSMLCTSTLVRSFKIVYNINISAGTPKYLIMTLDRINPSLKW